MNYGKKIAAVVLAAVIAAGAPSALTVGAVTSGDIEYNILDDGTVEITDYSGSDTELSIPSDIDGYKVTKIGEGAFAYCKSLTDVTIPDSVTKIGDIAFHGCTSLTDVTIGNSVTEIGYRAFQNCTSLKSVTIGNSVTEIGEMAFNVCYSLTSINVNEKNTKYSSQNGVLFNKDKTELIRYPLGKKNSTYKIPDSVKVIVENAFDAQDDNVVSSKFGDYRSSLESVTIPDSVTEIGDYAFRGCKSLTDVTIPDSVTVIGSEAFSYCYSLTSVTIPDSVTEIGDSAFYSCESLTIYGYAGSTAEEYAHNNNIPFKNAEESDIPAKSDFEYRILDDGTVEITDYRGSDTELSIPSDIDGYKVTKIGDYAFAYCYSLKNVTIPDSVTVIGESAFWGCTSLTDATIPDSVTKIGDYAFEHCYSLTSVTIPDSVTEIGNSAFNGCTSLTIYGYMNSTVEEYAREHGIPFKSILEEPSSNEPETSTPEGNVSSNEPETSTPEGNVSSAGDTNTSQTGKDVVPTGNSGNAIAIAAVFAASVLTTAVLIRKKRAR